MSRQIWNGKAQIVVGDKTSHGGVVISGSSTTSCEGKPIARKTDKVTCPKCKPHLFEIAEGIDAFKDNYLSIAFDGHKTTCGAVLIANSTSTKPDSLLMSQETIPVKRYDEQVKFEQEEMEGVPFLIETEGGQIYSGRVSQSFLLERIVTKSEETYTVYWGDEALAKQQELGKDE